YEQLGPHTLFLVDDYRENFDSITGERTLPAHPSIYVHAPTRLDPALAPAGHDTLIVHVPVGHIDETRMQNWPDLREQARQAVFRRLKLAGIHDLVSHLKFEINYTPLSWRKRYNLVMGSTHGLSHTLTQLGYLRPHNRHPRYHNLYFVGASTHPGTGVPTAMISARLTAKRVLDELAQSLLHAFRCHSITRCTPDCRRNLARSIHPSIPLAYLPQLGRQIERKATNPRPR